MNVSKEYRIFFDVMFYREVVFLPGDARTRTVRDAEVW